MASRGSYEEVTCVPAHRIVQLGSSRAGWRTESHVTPWISEYGRSVTS